MSGLFVNDVRLPDGKSAEILIQDGRIKTVGQGLDPPPDFARVAGRGRLVIPGAIDMHVHFRTPGGEHKETFATGSLAAAKGGTTTVADMPNTDPPTTTVERLETKLRLAQGAAVSVLINFGVEPDRLEELRRAVLNPAVKTVKVYMGPSTGVGGLAPEAVDRTFRLAAELNIPVMVHAEDMAMIQAEAQRHPHDARHHHLLRPLAAELSAVEQALALAKTWGNRLYLCHVTSAAVLDRVEASGIREQVFVEVCPHHLVLSLDAIAAPLENRYKVNPPLREESQRRELFAALVNRIDGLASDHAPHTKEEKSAPYDEAPSGIPGVEYLLPLALTWWREGHIGMQRMIDLTSANVARFLDLPKGSLQPGRDADLVLVDPEHQWRIGAGGDSVASKCGWSPYEGRSVLARPEVTIAGGEVVYSVDEG